MYIYIYILYIMKKENGKTSQFLQQNASLISMVVRFGCGFGGRFGQQTFLGQEQTDQQQESSKKKKKESRRKKEKKISTNAAAAVAVALAFPTRFSFLLTVHNIFFFSSFCWAPIQISSGKAIKQLMVSHFLLLNPIIIITNRVFSSDCFSISVFIHGVFCLIF